MANFIVVQDHNYERRIRFLEDLKLKISPIPKLTVQTFDYDSISVIWAISPEAPISTSRDDQGFGILFGEAIEPNQEKRLNALQLRTLWQEDPPPFDGFYAAVKFEANTGLTVGVDVLGCFPIYYFKCDETVIIGSCPDLFHAHPCCHRQLSLEGMVGLLMMKRIVNGQSLWEGINRLEEGNVITASLDYQVSEKIQYRLPCFQEDIDQSAYGQLSYKEQIDLLENELNQAVRRHIPQHEAHTLLLSGGLDSRTLCAFLRKHDVPVKALTWGRPTDLEAMCARSLAHICGWDHRILDIKPEHQRQSADFAVNYEHVSGWGGSLTGTVWSRLDKIEGLPPRVVTGLLMDSVICGHYRFIKGSGSFENFLEHEQEYGGLSLEQIQLLLKSEDTEAIYNKILAKLRKSYQAISDIPEYRVFAGILLRNRIRLGIHLWRMSFTAWPRVVVLDQKLLSISCQLPLKTTSRRKAQKDVIRTYFPYLAKIPVDGNSFNYSYLTQNAIPKQIRIINSLRRFTWKVQKKLGWERRYYYRLYNINSPPLKELRRKLRKSLSQNKCFDLKELDYYLPSSDEVIFTKDAIQESKGMLIILNLLLWMENQKICFSNKQKEKGV
jgi:hypothetical protein